MPNIKATNAPISKGGLFLVPNPSAAKIRQVQKKDIASIIKKFFQVGFIFFLPESLIEHPFWWDLTQTDVLPEIPALLSSLYEGKSGRAFSLPRSKGTSFYPQDTVSLVKGWIFQSRIPSSIWCCKAQYLERRIQYHPQSCWMLCMADMSS